MDSSWWAYAEMRRSAAAPAGRLAGGLTARNEPPESGAFLQAGGLGSEAKAAPLRHLLAAGSKQSDCSDLEQMLQGGAFVANASGVISRKCAGTAIALR